MKTSHNFSPCLRDLGVSVTALALILTAGCKPSSSMPPSSKPLSPVPVEVVTLKRGPITRNLTLPAEIRPYQQATLYAKVAGYLKTISVDKGDRVKEGDLLADIEVPEILADIAKAKAELDVAEVDFKRLSESEKKAPDLVVPQTVDNARGKVAVAKATLEREQTLLGFAKLTAPFSGIVTRRMVDAGAFIPAAASGSVPQSAALLTLTDFNKVRVQVAIPEAEVARVQEGQPLRLTTEDLPGRFFDGKVTRFSYLIDDTSKTMLAEAEMANPNLELRPGMYGLARIGVQRKEDAVLAPVDALLVEKSGFSVFTVADKKAKRIKVQTGFNDGANVEIIGGVEPGQRLVLLGNKNLADGQAVIVKEAK